MRTKCEICDDNKLHNTRYTQIDNKNRMLCKKHQREELKEFHNRVTASLKVYSREVSK